MKTEVFMVELDGRRVMIDQARQQVTLLDADGRTVSCETIQIAAGSVQGIFSALDRVVNPNATPNLHA